MTVPVSSQEELTTGVGVRVQAAGGPSEVQLAARDGPLDAAERRDVEPVVVLKRDCLRAGRDEADLVGGDLLMRAPQGLGPAPDDEMSVLDPVPGVGPWKPGRVAGVGAPWR